MLPKRVRRRIWRRATTSPADAAPVREESRGGPSNGRHEGGRVHDVEGREGCHERCSVRAIRGAPAQWCAVGAAPAALRAPLGDTL